MLIAERTSRAPSRTSLGFSLNEAVRIRKDIQARKSRLECPRCAGNLKVVGTRGTEELVWITSCSDCRLSVMVHCNSDDPR